MIVVLGNWGSIETIGEYALSLAACTPVMMFAYLQLSQVVAANSTNRFPLRAFFLVRVWTTLAALLAIFTATFCLASLRDIWTTVVVVAIAKSFEGISDLYQGLLRQKDRMKVLAITQIIRGACSLSAFSGIFVYTRSVPWAVAGLGTSWLLTLLAVDRPLALRYAREKSTEEAAMTGKTMIAQGRRLALESLPLGFTSLLIAMYAYFPQYLVEASWGKKELGVFVAVGSLPLVLQTVVLAASQASTSRFGRYCQTSDFTGFMRFYRLTLMWYVGMAATGMLATWFIGERLLVLLFPAEISRHFGLLVWTMGAAAISFASSYQSAYVALNRYNEYFAMWIVSTLVLFASAAILIPKYGCYGAAFAMILANTIRFVFIHVTIHVCARRWLTSPQV